MGDACSTVAGRFYLLNRKMTKIKSGRDIVLNVFWHFLPLLAHDMGWGKCKIDQTGLQTIFFMDVCFGSVCIYVQSSVSVLPTVYRRSVYCV